MRRAPVTALAIFGLAALLRSKLARIVIFAGILGVSASAFAVPPDDGTAAVAKPPTELATAEKAIAQKRWDDALAALERGYVVSHDPYFLYRRVLVLETMGKYDVALKLFEENRTPIVGSDRVPDATVVEQRLQDEVHKSSKPGRSTRSPWPVVAWVGGGALAATGAVLLILAQQNAHDLNCTTTSGAKNCSNATGPAADRAEYDRRKSNIRTLRVVGWTAVGVGAAAVLTGFVLPRQRSPRLAFAPLVQRDAAGAAVFWRF